NPDAPVPVPGLLNKKTVAAHPVDVIRKDNRIWNGVLCGFADIEYRNTARLCGWFCKKAPGQDKNNDRYKDAGTDEKAGIPPPARFFGTPAARLCGIGNRRNRLSAVVGVRGSAVLGIRRSAILGIRRSAVLGIRRRGSFCRLKSMPIR